ncbi:hypothetical protein ACFODZ_16065 [Marinicella sediminis]|uniref:Uncharacterized protein n=1 Tax=Marinicella sediminis TaxID=1792834 RepID=A0ABV7JF89_9GAMM|nr:hypothetical protein [Marinicella sediminis]
MEGDRLVNDSAFNCHVLSGLTVEAFYGIYSSDDPAELILVLLKLKEKKLWQRFFLDAFIGFWEEWEQAVIAEDLEDDLVIDLGEQHDVLGCQVNSIECTGDADQLIPSAIWFDIGKTILKMSFIDDDGEEFGSKLEIM